jgi:hypothetical protein
VPRIQYTYTLDQFQGNTFATRHALTAILTSYWNTGDTSLVYWSIDNTDFRDDGVAPALTSRDGLTNTLGVSHTQLIGRRYLQSLTGGVDVQFADAEGDNFAYNGVGLYAAAEVPIVDRLSLILEGGWGYRDYPRASLTPSRNENVWRGGVRLLHRINEYWSVAGVFNYDLFDSENPLFQAERVVGGVVTAFEW